jgi:hypothetical protein
MSRKKKPKSPRRRRALDDKLDQALQDTFPASDPVSLTQPSPSEGPDNRKTGGRSSSETRKH